MTEEKSPWLCHVCDYRSTVGEGLVCSECYKITCRAHIATTTALNQDSGLYEIRLVCVECQFRKQL